MYFDSVLCVEAADTRMNAEATCFTPYTNNICVLQHKTPGIEQSMNTNVITLDKASQYCTPKTVSTSACPDTSSD